MNTFKHKSYSFIFFTIFVSILISKVDAQVNNTFWNDSLAIIAKTTSQPGWIEFKDDSQLEPFNIFEKHKACFRLGSDDKMILVRIDEDQLGYKHYRYQQTYKGIKVEGAEFIVHSLNNSSCKSANGKIVVNLNLNIVPIVLESVALQNALNYIGANQYTWEIDSLSHLYPTDELIITKLPGNLDFVVENFRLAYKFKIFSENPFSKDYIYVDAQTGSVIKRTPLIYTCKDITGFTKYNGIVTITTKERGFPYLDCILKDECRGEGIHTKKRSGLVNVNASCPDCGCGSSILVLNLVS